MYITFYVYTTFCNIIWVYIACTATVYSELSLYSFPLIECYGSLGDEHKCGHPQEKRALS